MTYVSNDPSWWPTINLDYFFRLLDGFVASGCLDPTLICSFAVAAGVVMVYDWVLTLGQEIELIWRQRWSLMTVLYLIIRYIGLPYFLHVSRPTALHCANSSSLTISVHFLPMPPVSLTDAGARHYRILRNKRDNYGLDRHVGRHHDCSVACHVSGI
ncbi:uncharacterized protein HD556DRAFT_217022 [Suillus plorans]|uniref:DUF6533 domain-containing protein n=1 Tax=Suillus plorans TaxID=116603 RepID=A0A9P7DLT4_9AGAM|nr:uncharacterized protein HD556DRAFT_217022 [Suillus plorans]KAG1798077.1 hypothetical protein HD556DRAFT_217022 [Suillus plorans]